MRHFITPVNDCKHIVGFVPLYNLLSNMSGITVSAAPGCIKGTLGEGPHWVGSKGELLYVDICGKSVMRYVPATQQCFKVDLEGPAVSCVVPVASHSDKYLVCIGTDVCVLDWDGKSSKPSSPLKTLFTVDGHCKTNRINDGKCDASGRFWAGTMGYEAALGEFDAKKGSLYSFDLKGNVKSHLSEIDIGNGLAWSSDNQIMYYIDSFAYRVDAFDFNAEKGEISNRRSVYDFKASGESGIPDGMTIDSNGNLWVAVHDGGKVINIDPRTEKKIRQIDIPTKNLTSVTFGGPNLDILYATTAYRFLTEEELKAQPDAGAVFEVRGLGVEGVAAGVEYQGPI